MSFLKTFGWKLSSRRLPSPLLDQGVLKPERLLKNVVFFLTMSCIFQSFLIDPEALYALLRRGQLEDMLVLYPGVFRVGGVYLRHRFILQYITPLYLSTTGYRTGMPEHCLVAWGLLLPLLLCIQCKPVCICAPSHTPPVLVSFRLLCVLVLLCLNSV